MLKEKTVTLLKKIATKSSTLKNPNKIRNFLNKEEKQNKPGKSKG